MIYQMTSTESIIMKLAREFPEYNADLINDTIEWIGEACEAIGFFGQTEKKDNVQVTISNHRGKIPCDLYRLNGEPAYNGFPLPYGTGNFRYSKGADNATNGHFSQSDTFAVGQLVVDDRWTKNQLVDNILKDVGFNAKNYNPDADSYIITPGYFKTTFESGTITLDYEAFVRDENGMPMVPDYYEFKEAIAWYIKMKLIERGYQHPAVKYVDAVHQWEKFESKAYKKAALPDAARMNSFINLWTRQISGINPQAQFYETLRQPERYNYGRGE